MKTLMTILLTSLTSLTSLSALASSMICTPTIGYGNVNYLTENMGLSRISKIEIKDGEAGDGGYGVVLTLKGTKGAGSDIAKDVVHKLPWSSAFGTALNEYNNISTAQSTLSSPYISFEIENSGKEDTFLGALTFSSVKDSKYRRILTSRYNCKLSTAQ